MNRGTEILVGGELTGKTTELIKRSAESGIYILVANRKRAEILVKQATDMKIYMPFPVTLQEWLSSSDRFHGSSIHRDGLLIDDIDDVIKELFLPIEIKAVTLRTPNAIVNLDLPADVVEVRHSRIKWVNRPIAAQYATVTDANGEKHYGKVHDRIENNPVGYCGECGKRLDDTFMNYCPNCGAKMDGERREENEG